MKSSLELLDWPQLLEDLVRFAETPFGRERGRRLKPVQDPRARKALGECVAEAWDWLQDRADEPLLGELQDVAPVLRQGATHGGNLDGSQLVAVRGLLRRAERVRERFGAGGTPALERRLSRMPHFADLVRRLGDSLDERGEVLDGAHPDLAVLRAQLAKEEQTVRQLAHALIRRPEYKGCLRDGPPVHRDGRFMLAVRADAHHTIPGILHDRSASGSTVFLEPRELVEPQNRLAVLQAKERNLVHRILRELGREVMARQGEVLEAQGQLGSLDLILARARYGRHLEASQVVAGGEGLLELRQAWHPLLLEQERQRCGSLARAREAVVPFDLRLGEDFDLLVITGPNTGGKTATLKAIGLIASMAHCAIPVPVAQGSRVPEFDAVHADLGDEQSLQHSLSTFSSHLERIAGILRQATAKSLVLLDELGSGTDPKEGEALGHALLNQLEARRCKVVATTHLSGLKDLGFERDRVENASMEFDAVSLRPLFRLTLGLPGESNALTIAARHGIAADVLEEARRLLTRSLAEEDVRAAEQVRHSRARVLEKLRHTEEVEREVVGQRRELQERIRDLEERNRVLEEQKEQEIERLLRQVQREGQEILAGLESLPAELAGRLEPVRRFLEGLPESSTLSRRREAYIRTLRRDDPVYLPRYREHCRVRKVDRARQTVTVIYKALELEVPFPEIATPEGFGGG